MEIAIKIAEITGVSRGTVDRVLNNRPGVHEEVRKRVLSVVDAMDDSGRHKYMETMLNEYLLNE